MKAGNVIKRVVASFWGGIGKSFYQHLRKQNKVLIYISTLENKANNTLQPLSTGFLANKKAAEFQRLHYC